MQAKELKVIRDQIVSATSKFIAEADSWDSVTSIRQNAVGVFDTICDILSLDYSTKKRNREP